MKKKSSIKKWFLLVAVAAVAVGAAVWVSHLPSTEDEDTVYMTEAYAIKAVASLLTDTARYPEDASLPALEEGAAWYEPYAQYLYSRGLWKSQDDRTDAGKSESLPDGTGQSAGEESEKDLGWELLTWGQLRFLTQALSEDPRLEGWQPKTDGSGSEEDRPVPEQKWWDFFEELAQKLECENYRIAQLTVYGTDQTVEIASGRAATSEGKIRYGGFPMDSYIDKTIRVRLLGSELLAILNVTETTVVYSNVWLLDSTPEGLTVFMEGFTRVFPAEAPEGDYQGVLADLTLEQGTLTKISVKRDTIAGKVLAVRPDSIEIQGYGNVPLSEAVRVYKIYDGVEQKRLADIVVGYSVHEFIVADGEICGALALDNIEVETIRVLISNNGFNGSGHDQVTLSSDAPMRITVDSVTTEWPAGTEYSVTADSEEFQKGRITVESEEEIRILSLERSYGVPSYKGSMELALEDGKILVVNEVRLEDYLCRVVPSEMPAGHGLEALKVQKSEAKRS